MLQLCPTIRLASLQPGVASHGARARPLVGILHIQMCTTSIHHGQCREYSTGRRRPLKATGVGRVAGAADGMDYRDYLTSSGSLLVSWAMSAFAGALK